MSPRPTLKGKESEIVVKRIFSRVRRPSLGKKIMVLVASVVLGVLLASGVALAVTKIGTDDSDVLFGTKGSDQLFGKGDPDWIAGRDGNDVISGGPGSDKRIFPVFPGILNGGRGADVVSGGPGNDLLVDGPLGDSAVDVLNGGEGNDRFGTANRPAARDIVSCGAGRDTAKVDRKDIVTGDCEVVSRVYEGSPQPPPPAWA